jgi:hypothetical protein
LPCCQSLKFCGFKYKRKTAGILVRPGGRLALIMRRRDFLGFAGGWTFRNRPMRGNLF